MDKEFELVILNTNKNIEENSIIKFDKYLINGCRISIPNNKVTFINPLDNKLIDIQGIDRFKSQHLYIVSNEKIKDDEFDELLKQKLYFESSNGLIKIITDKRVKTFGIYKKIIATTDKSLMFDTGKISHSITCGDIPVYKSLPQIPQQFIEQYITEYNKGNIISDVLVEYESRRRENPDFIGDVLSSNNLKNILKINPDNTINIKIVKDSFSRDEVERIIILAWATASAYGENTNSADCKDWIKHNLN